VQIIAVVLFLALGLAQVVAGFVGADYFFGAFWAFVITFACLLLRFGLPMTVLGFFGAVYVWEWPWWGAALFCFPGLLLAVPRLIAATLQAITGKRGRAR
jgi:hypothetical protein